MKQDTRPAELIRFTWLLTGNEGLAAALIDATDCADGGSWDPLLVVRTFVGAHRLGLWPEPSAEARGGGLPLWSLPPLERAAFVLRYLLHLPAPQAACALNLAPPTFSRTIAQAVAFLANAAQGRPIDEGAAELTTIYQS